MGAGKVRRLPGLQCREAHARGGVVSGYAYTKAEVGQYDKIKNKIIIVKTSSRTLEGANLRQGKWSIKCDLLTSIIT